jgi:hypothetical protein
MRIPSTVNVFSAATVIVLLLPDDLGCNSPSNAPLVEDCCSCVILAELSACILIYGQAAWEPADRQSNQRLQS